MNIEVGIIMQIIGWVGVVCVIGMYFLLVTNRITGQNKWYLLSNIFGPGLIAISSYYQHAYPSVGVQVLVIAMTLFGLYKSTRVSSPKRKKKK